MLLRWLISLWAMGALGCPDEFGCRECHPDSTCALCSRSFLQAGHCQSEGLSLVADCEVYSADGHCQACLRGYFLSEGKCLDCEIENCAICEGGKCLGCFHGVQVVDNRCEKGKVPCETADCSICVSGEALAASKCVECVKFKGLYEGKCVDAPKNCQVSDQNHKCVRCLVDFDIQSDGSCRSMQKFTGFGFFVGALVGLVAAVYAVAWIGSKMCSSQKLEETNSEIYLKKKDDD
jgi:hypothetical protein